jgi:hypothetical protein
MGRLLRRTQHRKPDWPRKPGPHGVTPRQRNYIGTEHLLLGITHDAVESSVRDALAALSQ